MTDAEAEETRRVPERILAYFATLRGRLLVAEVMFVAGWSLMWATSLHIIPFVPSAVWLTLMVLGLVRGAMLAKHSRRSARRLEPAIAGQVVNSRHWSTFRLRRRRERTLGRNIHGKTSQEAVGIAPHATAAEKTERPVL
jgi:hypothetical protein